MGRRKSSGTSKSTAKSAGGAVRISTSTLPEVKPIIRGSIIDWFISIVEAVLGVEFKSVGPSSLRHIDWGAIKKVAEGELKRLHLPTRVGTLGNLGDALDIIDSYISGREPKCGRSANISGGIPPELTAEVAEFVRVFGGPGREKRKYFELCEDVLALAELGAFFSFCGRRVTEERRTEYHYMFSDVLRYVPEFSKKIYYALKLKGVMRRLIENDAPFNTIIVGAATCVAKHLRDLPYDTRVAVLKRGITIEYLRLERSNVLNVTGFNLLSVTELVRILKKAKIVNPLWVAIRSYPRKNDANKVGELKKLRNLVDGIAKDLVLYTNNVQGIIYAKDVARVVREPAYLYNIARRVKVFMDDLNVETERLIDNYLKPSKYGIRSVLEDVLKGVTIL